MTASVEVLLSIAVLVNGALAPETCKRQTSGICNVLSCFAYRGLTTSEGSFPHDLTCDSQPGFCASSKASACMREATQTADHSSTIASVSRQAPVSLLWLLLRSAFYSLAELPRQMKACALQALQALFAFFLVTLAWSCVILEHRKNLQPTTGACRILAHCENRGPAPRKEEEAEKEEVPKGNQQKKENICSRAANCLVQVEEQVRLIVAATRPAFLNITVNAIKDSINFGSDDDPSVLVTVVKTMFEMVRPDVIDICEEDHSKHARCGETYADLMFALRVAVPQFSVPDDDKPMIFTRVLLNITQDWLEQEMKRFTDPETELSERDMNSLIAVVSFIGHLYVRELVAIRVVAQVIHDLIGVKDALPLEIFVRCACELMHLTGPKIDSTKEGSMFVTQVLARLSNLVHLQKLDTDEPLYPKDVKDAIMGVHSGRFNKWPARSATRVLVQFHIVQRVEAQKVDGQLFVKKTLPHTVKQPRSDPLDLQEDDEDHKHVKITSVISGNPMAVMFSLDMREKKASDLAKDIFRQTGIHFSRLMVFGPNSKLLKGEELLLNAVEA